ncbi:hypothetical protein ACFLQ2_02500 [archaeon]
MQDDELALKLVELYVVEVSKGHEKRQMGLDTLLNAYFYALLRITRKNKETAALHKAVEREEEVLEEEYKPEVPTEGGKEPYKEKEGSEDFKFD